MHTSWLKNCLSYSKKGEVITSLLLLSLGAMAIGSFLGIRELQKDGKFSVFTRAESCIYSSTVSLKDENGQVFNITGQEAGVSIRSQFEANNKTYDGVDYFQNGSIAKIGQQLTEPFQNVPVLLTLNVDPNRYEIVNNFCEESPQTPNAYACSNDGRSNRVQVRLFCGKTVNYGWTLRLKAVDASACSLDSTAWIKDPTGKLIKDSNVKVTSSFTTTLPGGRDYFGNDPFTDGQIVKNNLPLTAAFQNVPVTLKLQYDQSKYEIDHASCTDAPKDSSSNVNANNPACGNFLNDTIYQTLRCNKKIDYGWVLKPKPSYVDFWLDEAKPNPYYRCFSRISSTDKQIETGGNTSQGNIKCSGDYDATSDTLRVSFQLKNSELSPLRLTLNTNRCATRSADGRCLTKAIPERYLREFELTEGANNRGTGGDKVDCYWKNPFTSTNPQDVTCSGPDTHGSLLPTVTLVPTGMARGTIDSLRVDYKYIGTQIVNNPGGGQSNVPAELGASYYVNRSVDGCPFLGTSACPKDMTCTVERDGQGNPVSVQLKRNGKSVRIDGVVRHMGCACTTEQASPEKGVCDERFAPQKEQVMENGFCFGKDDVSGQSSGNKMTCRFDGQRCSFNGNNDGGACGVPPAAATQAPLPTTVPTGGAPVCSASAACIYPEIRDDGAGHADIYCYTGRCKAGYENCGEPGGSGISEQCTFAGTACGVPAVRVTCPGYPTLIPTRGAQINPTPTTPIGGGNVSNARIHGIINLYNPNNTQIIDDAITINYIDMTTGANASKTVGYQGVAGVSYDITSADNANVPILTSHVYRLSATIETVNGTASSPNLTATVNSATTNFSDLTITISSASQNTNTPTPTPTPNNGFDIQIIPTSPSDNQSYSAAGNVIFTWNVINEKPTSFLQSVQMGYKLKCGDRPYQLPIVFGVSGRSKTINLDPATCNRGLAMTVEWWLTGYINGFAGTVNSPVRHIVFEAVPPGPTEDTCGGTNRCLFQNQCRDFTIGGQVPVCVTTNICASGVQQRTVRKNTPSNECNFGSVNQTGNCVAANSVANCLDLATGRWNPTDQAAATATPEPSRCTGANECMNRRDNKCYPTGRNILLCDSKCTLSGMRYVNITEDSQNACGFAQGACAPPGTVGPCVSGTDNKVQNSTTNARTADVNNDGQVGVIDFFQARSSFGKTITVNGQQIKVTAQYISLVLSSIGKTVTK